MAVVAVLGSGMAGLGASHRLRAEKLPHVVFDSKAHFGGHTFSETIDGFTFDEGPHISFTKIEHVRELLAQAVQGEYEVIQARVNNYWQGVWLKHPAQCNLYGLPTDLIVKVIKDMVEAKGPESARPENYAEWLLASFGRTFAETFPMQYGRKYHTTEAANMSTDWLGPRLYRPSLEQVLAGALSPVTPEVHYVSDFRYPTRGGFLAYLKPFAKGIDLRLSHHLIALDPVAKTLSFANGVVVEYEQVISSIPLPELVPMIAGVPADVVEASRTLACTTCVVVNIGIDRPDISEWHWTYFYDDDVCFTRISFPHLLSPNNAPAGMSSIQVEVYFSPKYRPLTNAPDEWIEPVIRDLIRCGVIREDDRIVFKQAVLVKYANVIFDLDRAPALATVQAYLERIGVRSCGRYGEWGYHWTDESFVSGEKAAQHLLDHIGSPHRGVTA